MIIHAKEIGYASRLEMDGIRQDKEDTTFLEGHSGGVFRRQIRFDKYPPSSSRQCPWIYIDVASISSRQIGSDAYIFSNIYNIQYMRVT